jgi:hypothetical protein
MAKKWRAKSTKGLFARPIYQHEWANLVRAMKEDGLDCFFDDDSLVWMHGDYRVTFAVVRKVWGLTVKQGHRLRDYIIENDPWGAM